MKRLGIVVSVVLCLALGVMAGCATTAKGPSDEEQLAGIMADWKAAIEAKNIDGIMKPLSEKFSGQNGESKAEMKDFVAGNISEGNLDGAKVDLASSATKINGEEATISNVRLATNAGAMTIEFSFKKEADKVWRIASLSSY